MAEWESQRARKPESKRVREPESQRAGEPESKRGRGGGGCFTLKPKQEGGKQEEERA